MNPWQRLWWEQARSDYAIFRLLRGGRVEPCHQLHYLQMATEKLGKAYFWRTGSPPAKTHAAFVRFIHNLGDRSRADRDRIADYFGLGTAAGLARWSVAVTPLAYELERLAPDLAGDGPNPEYPWPWADPAHAPTAYDFAVWPRLTQTAPGR